MPTRAEWLHRRRKGIGGSDIGALFGLSPWRTPWDVYMDKMGLVPDDPPDAAKSIGIWLEETILEWAAADAGMIVEIPDRYTTKDGPEPWAFGTADGCLADVLTSQIVGIDAKVDDNIAEWGPDGSDLVPEYIALQAHWYNWIYDADAWHIATYFPFSRTRRRFVILRDIDIEAHIVTYAGEWWHRHIVNQTPPPIDSSKAAARWASMRHRQTDQPDRRPATEQEQWIGRELHNCRQLAKVAKESGRMLSSSLLASMGECERIWWDDGHVSTYWNDHHKTWIVKTNVKGVDHGQTAEQR